MIYLPLRSYGDFVITLNVIQQFSGFNLQKIPVVLPKYLTDLYRLLNGDEYFEIRDILDFENVPAFNDVKKHCRLKTTKKIFDDYKYLYPFLKKNETYILDFRSRRMIKRGVKFLWPSDEDNIYEGKKRLLEKVFFIKGEKNIGSYNIPSPQYKKITIFPESRVNAKALSSSVVNQIDNNLLFNSHVTQIAYLSKDELKKNEVSYHNFGDLINIIQASDFIISTDSLPAHIAERFGIPHFVIYNSAPNFQWMTPFVVKNNFYLVNKGEDHKIVDNIKVIINTCS